MTQAEKNVYLEKEISSKELFLFGHQIRTYEDNSLAYFAANEIWFAFETEEEFFLFLSELE